MIYDSLDKSDLQELLFKADNTIQALLDRDEARTELVNLRAKHEEKKRALDSANRQVDQLRDQLRDLKSLPSYHQVLELICTELGVCGSPTMHEAVADVKKRLWRR